MCKDLVLWLWTAFLQNLLHASLQTANERLSTMIVLFKHKRMVKKPHQNTQQYMELFK